MEKEIKLKKDGTPDKRKNNRGAMLKKTDDSEGKEKSNSNKVKEADAKTNSPTTIVTEKAPSVTEIKEQPPKEPEIPEDKQTSPESSFDPLEGEPTVLPHAKYNVSPEELKKLSQEPLKEPTIKPPDLDYLEKQEKMEAESEKKDETPPDPEPKKENIIDNLTNPAVANMPKEEINLAGKQTARLYFDCIRWIHKKGQAICSITDQSLEKKAINGKFDMDLLDAEIPFGRKTKTVHKLIAEYNETVETICQVDEEFVEEYYPVLVRICIKHGWVLNDELYFLIGNLKYLFDKGGALVSIALGFNSMLKQISTHFKEERNSEKNENSKKE